MKENCPYCNAEVEINHDDGYGYEEDRTFEQECWNCNKIFTYTTSIHFYHDLYKADCLNGSKHKFRTSYTVPREYTEWVCEDCDKTIKLTEDEMSEFLKTGERMYKECD